MSRTGGSRALSHGVSGRITEAKGLSMSLAYILRTWIIDIAHA